jgi:hypothetical protein
MRKNPHFIIILLLVGSALRSQPVHQQLLFSHPLTNTQSDQAQIVNSQGSFGGTGWQAVTANSQLKVTMNQALPLEGTMKINVTNFDPVRQNQPEVKQHIINMYSRIYDDNKDIFETDGAWWNIRTGVAYSSGSGLAGFKFLSASRGIDTRDEIRCIENATWDLGRVYEFKVTWTDTIIYCFFDNQLLAELPFSGQIEPFKYFLIGRDNLIYGYAGQPGPIYSNLRIYGEENIVTTDQTPPHVEMFSIPASQQINVLFDEAVDAQTAMDIENYSIAPDVLIQSATLSDDLRQIELTTGVHLISKPYQLSISNIADTSALHNVMADTTIAYTYTQDLIIGDISQVNYKYVQRQAGDSCYVDRDFRITSIPGAFADYYWILTANDHKLLTGYPFLTFEASKNVSIIVAYDARLTQVPSWLQDWTLTGATITTQDASLRCFSKNYPAGQISLGANQGSGSCSMYLLLVKKDVSTGIDDTIPPDKPRGVRIVGN